MRGSQYRIVIRQQKFGVNTVVISFISVHVNKSSEQRSILN